MTAPDPLTHRLRVAHLNPRAANDFALRPGPEARAAIAAELDLLQLPQLEFQGRITAEGGDGWLLQGRLRARVVQPCVVTLAPVSTRLDEDIRRRYSPHLAAPESDEVEMPDETLEPLGQFIDLSAVMIEALALALPEYPRANGAELSAAAPEEAPDDRRRPFEGLDQLLKASGRDPEPDGQAGE